MTLNPTTINNKVNGYLKLTKQFKRTLIVMTFFIFGTAQGEDDTSYLDLTLEELLQVKVVTVSKREESINDAPGVISVYTANDIKSFGARNLKDVLLRIPNFFMLDSYTFNATGNTLRAGATQHINNHVLYLINGRPLRESQNGGRHTDINLMFPIDAIERIEVVRGPGSVLYGSNAFSGTINIITKENGKDLGGGINASIGSDGYKRFGINGFVNTEQGFELNANISLLSEDGAEITAIDSQVQTGSSQLSRDGYFAKLDGSYKGFTIETMASELKLPSISGAFKWSSLGDWTHTREYINVGYQHEFNENWSSSFNYTYNQSGLDIIIPNPIKYLSDGYLYELTVNGKINKHADLVFGIVQDNIKGDLAYNGGRYKSERNSIYAQFDYRFSPNTKVTLGAQRNKAEKLDANISPRIALIHKFHESWSMKALLSEAYRSSYGTEIGFQASFLQGNPKLKPESIQTAEFQLIYSSPKATISSTIYHSETDELIGRERINGNTTFVNIEQEIYYKGIEFEGRWAITPNLQFHGNASYQVTEDEHGMKDIMIASNTMFKMGLSYTALPGLTASIWNNYFGDVSKLENNPAYNPKVVNPDPDAVNLLSINIVTNVGDLLAKPQWQRAEVAIFANNILNADVWFPDIGFKTVNTYPQSHARGIFINFSISY